MAGPIAPSQSATAESSRRRHRVVPAGRVAIQGTWFGARKFEPVAPTPSRVPWARSLAKVLVDAQVCPHCRGPLLVLAGDRNGVSFYHYDSLCALMARPLHAYLDARNGLIAKDLIAFDGSRFQVL